MSIRQIANESIVDSINELIIELQRAKNALGDAPIFIRLDAANKWKIKMQIDKASNQVLITAGDHA